MYIIYGVVKKGGKFTKALAFDTMNNSTVHLNRRNIENNIREIYGICVRNGNIELHGYSRLPVIEDGNIAKNKEIMTLVGVIRGNKSEYVIIKLNGILNKVDKDQMIRLINNGIISNTVKSRQIVRLKVGKLPELRNKSNKNSGDTVSKVKDIVELSKEMSTVGVGQKFLGRRIRDNKIGMVKRSVSINGYDNINEVMCHRLGKLFGVRVCEASLEKYEGKEWVMSVYEYNMGYEKILSCKNMFGIENFHSIFSVSEIEKRISAEAAEDFKRMVIFDTITRQTDRHIRNFSFIGNKMYPLYDNGRCLFWDVDELRPISRIDLIDSFVTNEHGYGWNYIDGVLGVQECRKLINTEVRYKDIMDIVSEFYNKDRAKILSDYMYWVYNIIVGGAIYG